MQRDERLTQIQLLLDKEPSKELWEGLCKLLNTWPEDERLGEAIDCVEQQLTGWSDNYRQTPWIWRKKILEQANPRLRIVRGLNLYAREVGDKGLATLAGMYSLTNLTQLYLDSNNIGNAGAVALAQSPYLTNLTILQLRYNNIGVEGMKALAQSQNLSKLSQLRLDENQIGDAGALALAQSPYLNNLTILHLLGNGIGTEGAKALAQSPNLSNLTDL